MYFSLLKTQYVIECQDKNYILFIFFHFNTKCTARSATNDFKIYQLLWYLHTIRFERFAIPIHKVESVGRKSPGKHMTTHDHKCSWNCNLDCIPNQIHSIWNLNIQCFCQETFYWGWTYYNCINKFLCWLIHTDVWRKIIPALLVKTNGFWIVWSVRTRQADNQK